MVAAGRWLARIVLGATLPFVAANATEPARSAVEARSPLRGEVVVAANDGIFVLDVGARTRRRLTRGDDDLAPSWSPDGSRVAFVRGGSIFVVAANGGTPHVVYSGLADLERVSWAPDSRRFAFVDARAGRAPQEFYNALYVADADARRLRRLTSLRAHDDSPAWSPDGPRIAFVRFARGRARVMSIRPNGTGLRTLGGRNAADPAWSPDGRRLAYADARRFDSAAGLGIELIDPTSPLRGRRRIAPGADGPIRWSPDGSRLAFLARSDALDVVRADGRGRRRLFREATDMSWSPDGRWLAVDTLDAVAVPADGGLARVLARDVAWSQWRPGVR